jgi:L-2-hydroxyglutarate oxidase LhgO
LSRQLWSHLVTKGAIPDPHAFIESCPHMNFVWGDENVAFLRDRYKAMSAHHCYHVLEFGTELIGSADNSIAALLGASPGASTAAFIAFEVLEKCFEKELAGGWRDKLKTIIPTYGTDLARDAAACRETRAKTAAVLGLTNV